MAERPPNSEILAHVTAGAHVNHVEGWSEDGRLRIKVRAVAEKGRANSAVIELLANFFSVAKSQIEIVSGAQSRIKRIRVHTSR